MAREQLKTLTEPMYYLLLALITPQHGYGIMQNIAALTEERVQLGAGTLYALLARFETEGIISQIMVKDRKKIYQITPKGAEVLTEEFCRLNRMVEDGRQFFDSLGTLHPIDYAKAEQEQEQEAAQSVTAEAPQTQKEGSSEDAPTPEPEADGRKAEKEKEPQEPREKEDKKRFGRGFRKGIFAT